MTQQIQLRRGTTTEWSNANPRLAEAEVGVDTSLVKMKIGNGVDNWNDLPFVGVQGAQGATGSGSQGAQGAQGAQGPAGGGSSTQYLERAVSDEVSNLTTGTAKLTFRMPFAMTLSAVRLNVNTAPTGAAIIVNVRENGTTIFSTRPQIDATAKTSVGSGTPAVISDSALADDAEITVDIDQIGSTVPGKGLKICFIGVQA
jgi:hypothetical protein